VTDVPSPSLTHLVAFADTEFEQAEKAVARRFVRDTPAVQQAWDVIKETKDHRVIRHFVDRFPSTKRRVVADTRLAALGQKQITLHVPPSQPLNADETVLAQAAVDSDVRRCFELGDQTAPECLKAFERFPDIARFADDIRFTIRFCEAMGNPNGCVPTVKTTWNFPAPKPDGGPTGSGGAGTTSTGTGGGGIPAQAPPQPHCSVCASPPPEKKLPPIGSLKGLKYSHHGHVKLQGSGSNLSNTGVKTTTGLKVVSPPGIKTITPVTKTPKLDVVRPPHLNVPVAIRR